MSKFLDKLIVTEVSDSIWAIADHPFRYESDIAGRMFTVPVGFFTDFASVPRFLPLIYALIGDEAHEAAAIHDWLYYSAIVQRVVADKVLREAILLCQMPAWKANLFYSGVRIGGWAAWNGHRKLGDPAGGKFANSPDILNKFIKAGN